MKYVWKDIEPEVKKINKKKIIITTIVVVIAIAIIIIVGLYMTNRDVRDWIDRNIFRKEVEQDKAITIDFNETLNSNVYAFNRYIGILNQTKFTIYGSTGNKEEELEIQISNPIFSSANRFLAIAENGGQRLYLISDKNISWQAEIDGNISQIFVNKNGYVAVIITGTSHKAVIKTFSPDGKEMFTTFLANTRAVDISISNDNKYLAIAEVDTSGAVIQSGVRIMSVDKAEKDPTNSLEKTYKSETGKLITNIKYQDKGKLICMYTDSINIIENETESELVNSNDKKITFQSIDLENSACYVEEKSSGLFTADSIVSIINSDNKETKQYLVNYVAREIYTNGNIIALNLGTDIEFISTGGWLVKRYVANQEITNIVVSDSIAGIIYRDKIEIINL